MMDYGENYEDSFVWVDVMLVEKMEDIIHASGTDAVANVTQQNVDSEEILNIEETGTSDDNKELVVEQLYWEKHDYMGRKLASSNPKYISRQRLTQRELDMIAYQKTIGRSPSYYQFDKSTTLILNMLRDKKIVGDYHNIVGHGKNSVVIHAHWPASARSSYRMGVAVKVYKLRNDVSHNDAMLKRVQNEYNHLTMLRRRMSTLYTPRPLFKCRNVIATLFFGFDQETSPSIGSLPDKLSGKMYNILVSDLYKLYNNMYLVHGRLSTKNILYCCNSTKYIGWAHSVDRDHPLALRKLMRDCHFITEFFKKRGIPVVTKEQLFKNVTGLDNINIKALNAISRKDLWQGQLTNPNKEIDNSNNKPRWNARFK